MSTQIDQLANGLPTSMGKRRPSHSTHADDNTRDVVEGEVGNVGSMHAPTETDVRVAIDEELKLPPRPSLVIVLMSNVLMQVGPGGGVELTASSPSSSLSRRVTLTQSIWAAQRLFPVS